MASPILQYFEFEHLPEGPLKSTSRRIHGLAHFLDGDLPDGAEKSAGLRKLLEAKDCLVRAALPPAAGTPVAPAPHTSPKATERYLVGADVATAPCTCTARIPIPAGQLRVQVGDTLHRVAGTCEPSPAGAGG